MPRARILIVEDEGIEALDMQQRLQSLGYDATDIVFSGEDAVRKAVETAPDLVLMDIMLNGEIDGVTAAEQIRAVFDVPIVYLTAYADEDTLRRAKITEPYGYIVKPFRDREVHITIDMALYRHQMERKLRESERWLATTLRSIGDGVIAADKEGLITFMNEVAENLTGWKLGEAYQKNLAVVLNMVSRESREPLEDPVARVAWKGSIVNVVGRIRLIARDGREIPIDSNASPIKDDKGRTVGVIVVCRDVTEREKAEEELRKAYAELEERVMVRTADLAVTNRQLKDEIERRSRAERWLQERNIELANAKRAKDQFLASLGHQLRAALNVSVGVSEALVTLPAPPAASPEQELQTIRQSAEYVLSLMSDLLTLVKIESGTGGIRTEPVEVGGVIHEVMGSLKRTAERKGLKFIDSTPGRQVIVQTDRRALSQILLNLANNTISLTEMGRVHLEVTQQQNGAECVTEISVVGTGTSREEQQKRLLEAFRQLESSSLWTGEGAGIGLHLSQRLAQLIGGTISLKSVHRKGCVFTLTLR